MNFYRRNLVIYRVANLHDKHSINFLPSTCQCVNDWSNNFTLSYFNGRILLLKNIYNHFNGIKKWNVILYLYFYIKTKQYLLISFQDVHLDNNNTLLYHHQISLLLLVKPLLSVVWSEIELDVFNGLKED